MSPFIPLPKTFGLRPSFSCEYLFDSKWFCCAVTRAGTLNHFIVGIRTESPHQPNQNEKYHSFSVPAIAYVDFLSI